MSVPRTREELERAAEQAEKWLDEMDPDDPALVVSRPEGLSQLAVAFINQTRVEGRADDAVAIEVRKCRELGRSWVEIGAVLGLSKQYAQDRYASKIMQPRLEAASVPNLGVAESERDEIDKEFVEEVLTPSHDAVAVHEPSHDEGWPLGIPRNTWVDIPGTGIQVRRHGSDFVGVLRWRRDPRGGTDV